MTLVPARRRRVAVIAARRNFVAGWRRPGVPRDAEEAKSIPF
jgi:hypothetical protein